MVADVEVAVEPRPEALQGGASHAVRPVGLAEAEVGVQDLLDPLAVQDCQLLLLLDEGVEAVDPFEHPRPGLVREVGPAGLDDRPDELHAVRHRLDVALVPVQLQEQHITKERLKPRDGLQQ